MEVSRGWLKFYPHGQGLAPLRRWHLCKDLKGVREWAFRNLREEAPRQREQPVQRPWGSDELWHVLFLTRQPGRQGLHQVSQLQQIYRTLNCRKLWGGGGMSSSLSRFFGKTWCQKLTVNLNLSQKTMGPWNQWSVRLKVNGQRAGAQADHMEFVNKSGLKKNFPVRGRNFWPASKKDVCCGTSVQTRKMEICCLARNGERGSQRVKLKNRSWDSVVCCTIPLGNSLIHLLTWKIFITGLLCASTLLGVGDTSMGPTVCEHSAGCGGH